MPAVAERHIQPNRVTHDVHVAIRKEQFTLPVEANFIVSGDFLFCDSAETCTIPIRIT